MSSIVVKMLAERPEGELDGMRLKLEAEQAKAASEVERITMELGQVQEALASKRKPVRGSGRSARRRNGGPSTFQRVKAFVTEHGGDFSPADASDALKAEGYTGSPSGVYNAFRRMTEDEYILKVGNGLYRLSGAARDGGSGDSELASSNGSQWEPLSEAQI